jgi:hypothetical protein
LPESEKKSAGILNRWEITNPTNSACGQKQGRSGAGDAEQFFFFSRAELIGLHLAYAERAAEAGAIHHRHGETALDIGLASSRLCHAAGIRLQIAKLHGRLPFRRRSGDPLSHGDGLNDRDELRRDGHGGDELQVLVCWVEPVDRASGAAEVRRHFCEKEMPVSLSGVRDEFGDHGRETKVLEAGEVAAILTDILNLTMKMSAAFLVLSWLLFAAVSESLAQGQRVVGRTIYHKDKSYTQSVSNPETREMTEMTYTKDEVLTVKKVFLLNEKGEPLQGNVYDGRGTLVARVECLYDRQGRRTEDRLMNLRGEIFQQVLHEYDPTGKALKPKVINSNPGAAPSIRPQTIDYTQQTMPAGAPASNPAADRYAPVPIPNAQVQSSGMGVAPVKPPEEEKPKANFFKRLFKKD